jgi:hypothetical protein
MTNDIPTPEEFKSKAKTIRKFMNEKYNIDISHSHSLELASQLSDFKDWNTAVAAAKSKGRLPTFIMSVGKMMKVLAKFDPSAKLEMWHLQRPDREMVEEFKFKEGEYCVNTYSLIFDGVNEKGATFQLKLEDQSSFDSKGIKFDPLDRIFPHPFDTM